MACGSRTALLVCLVLAGGLNIGSVIANFPTIVVHAYAKVVGGFDPDSKDVANKTILSFFVSSILIGAPISVFITPPIIRRIGKKATCMLLAFLVASCLSLTLIPVNYVYLIVMRFIAGVPSTSFLIMFPAWVAELSPSAIRGRLTACLQLGNSMGTMFVYLIVIAVKHNYALWQLPTCFTILSCTLEFILAMFIKELDPPAKHAQGEHAKHSSSVAVSLNSEVAAHTASNMDKTTSLSANLSQQPSFELSTAVTTKTAADEDELAYTTVTASATVETLASSGTEPAGARPPVKLREIFCNRIYRRCILISVCMPLMHQGIGVNAIVLYAGSIFQRLNFPDSDVIGACLLLLWCALSGLMALPLVERKGRRYLVFIGMPIILISLLFLAFSYLITNQTIITVFLLISIFVYFYAFSFSIGPLMFTICGECFPEAVRMQLISFTFLIFRIVSITVTISFPYLLDALYIVFFAYFCIGLVSTVLCWFSLPELKQQSLAVVEKAMLTEHVFERFTLTGRSRPRRRASDT